MVLKSIVCVCVCKLRVLGVHSYYALATSYPSCDVFFIVKLLFIWLQEVDIWSFGCVLLELLTLQVPYLGLSDSHIYDLLQVWFSVCLCLCDCKCGNCECVPHFPFPPPPPTTQTKTKKLEIFEKLKIR